MNKSLNCFSDKALIDMHSSAVSEYKYVRKFIKPSILAKLSKRIDKMADELIRRGMVQA